MDRSQHLNGRKRKALGGAAFTGAYNLIVQNRGGHLNMEFGIATQSLWDQPAWDLHPMNRPSLSCLEIVHNPGRTVHDKSRFASIQMLLTANSIDSASPPPYSHPSSANMA